MNRYDYDIVRKTVSAEDAAVQYGLKVTHHTALCPFHDDHSPSLSFHGKRFRCFSCDVSGSSIDLTAQLLGISPAEAVQQLAQDFRIPIGEQPSAETKKKHVQQKREADTYREYNAWRDRTLQTLCTCYRLGYQAILHGCPEGTETAVIWLPVVESWLDLLEDNYIDRQMEIFRIRREVAHRCRMILASMNGRSGVA